MKHYILELKIEEYFEGQLVTSALSGRKVKEKDLFYKTRKTYEDKVLDKDWVFDYLEPYDSEDEPKTVLDFHHWTLEEPDDISSKIVSDRLKNILDSFKLYPNKFYEAKVKFKDDILKYWVWQYFIYGDTLFTDFEHSRFCNWHFSEKIGNESIQVNNLNELDKIEEENDWKHSGYSKAVMKPEFFEYDCMDIGRLGLVISERLKNAIEAASPRITGLEIIDCPVVFERSSEM